MPINSDEMNAASPRLRDASEMPLDKGFCVPTAAGSTSPQFLGSTPTLELDLPSGFAIPHADNPLVVDAVPEYPKMYHNSREEDVAVASIQLKVISSLSSRVLSHLKAQVMEGQHEATIPPVTGTSRKGVD